MRDNEGKKNNIFWKIFIPVCASLLVGLIAAAFGYGGLNQKVESNCKINEKQQGNIDTVLIQQGKMEAKLENIESGIRRIEKKLE